MPLSDTLHTHAHALQGRLLRAYAGHASAGLPQDRWTASAARVGLDAWATLYRWHECGERIWRISAAAADETADMLLPPALPLAIARTRAEAVAYQLPDRDTWIVLARHAPAPCAVTVLGPEIGWAYAQPVLTYCTALDDGTLAAGYYSLADMPTPAQLALRPGLALGRTLRALSEADISEEDYRVSLALIHHYLPRS